MGQLIFILGGRFIVGGVVVSTFAVLADLLKPKSFAGLFGAAPSIALATLAVTAATDGKSYVAQEARSMIGGAIAFFVYAWAVMWVMRRGKTPATLASSLLLLVWLATGLGLWLVWLR